MSRARSSAVNYAPLPPRVRPLLRPREESSTFLPVTVPAWVGFVHRISTGCGRAALILRRQLKCARAGERFGATPGPGLRDTCSLMWTWRLEMTGGSFSGTFRRCSSSRWAPEKTGVGSSTVNTASAPLTFLLSTSGSASSPGHVPFRATA